MLQSSIQIKNSTNKNCHHASNYFKKQKSSHEKNTIISYQS